MAAALVGLLNEAAGEYVEGLERSQLDFSGVLTGRVLLRHLQLKRKAFDELLPLPAEPEFNYIGKVQLDVPVYSLGTAPLLAEVRDVLLVLSVTASDKWDAEAFLSLYQQQKAATLAAGEYKALFSSMERGLLWQLLLKLLSSFTAVLRDVHLRIEDRHSVSGRPFALGLCLKSAVLHAAPRGENFSEAGVCRASGGLADDTFFKVLSVEGLGLYVDSLAIPASPQQHASSRPRASCLRDAAADGDICSRPTDGGSTRSNRDSSSVERREARDRRRRNKWEASLGSTSPLPAQREDSSSGSLTYNERCRETYEAIVAQVLQEETAGDSRPAQQGDNWQGQGGVGSPWGAQGQASNNTKAQGCPGVATFCCNTGGGSNSFLPWTEETPAARAEATSGDRRRSSVTPLEQLQDFRRRGNSSSSSSSNDVNGSSPVFLDAEDPSSFLVPDPTESWLPLLRRYQLHIEDLESPEEDNHSSLAPAAGARANADVSVEMLSCIRLEQPSTFGSNGRKGGRSPSIERPAFLPPARRQQQQQQQQAAAAAAASVGADPARDSSGSQTYSSCDNSQAPEPAAAGECYFDVEDVSPAAAAAAPAIAAAVAGHVAEKDAAASCQQQQQQQLHQQQHQQQQQQMKVKRMQPLDRRKLNEFREFFSVLWDVRHEYILSPVSFKGQGKLYLTLVPTLPPDGPLERCWSPWGRQRAAQKEAAEKGDTSLPSCTLFVTLLSLKLTFSSSQALQLWKWLEYSFALYGAWSAGLLGTLEKARASPGDTQRYLLCWPVKLLRCPNPLAVLQEASLLLLSKHDVELASRGEEDVPMQQQQRQQQLRHAPQQQQTLQMQKQQLLQPDEQQQEGDDGVLEGIETLEDIDAFCSSFEEKHSLQTIWYCLSCFLLLYDFTRMHNSTLGVDFALDLAISDLQLLVACEGRGIAVPAPRLGQRLFAMECACLHYHLQVGVTGDQTLSMEVEIYPTTVLTVARDLESALIPPEVSVLLLLEPSRQKTKHKRKANPFFNVLQKVLGRGDEGEEPPEGGPAPEQAQSLQARSAAAAAAAAAAAESNDLRNGDPRAVGQAAQRVAAATEAAAEEPTGRVKDYRKRLEAIRAWSPGVYMRMDSQLFRTLHAPDLTMLLHSCAGIVVVVSPQRSLLVLGECQHLLDAGRTKELLLSSNIQRAALLRQGEAFCSAVAGGDIQHPNCLLDVELHKTVSFVVPRLASRLECEGIHIDLGSVRAKSLLQPRRLTYPSNMDAASLVDTYSCELTGLTVARTPSCSQELMRLRMLLGGLVVNFPKRLSSVLQLSAAAAAAATAAAGPVFSTAEHQQRAETVGPPHSEAAADPVVPLLPIAAAGQQHQQQQHSKGGGKHEREAQRGSAGATSEAAEKAASSFLVRPVKTSVLSVRIAHDKFRQDIPALHVDIIQESVAVSVSQHDIELLANVAAESLEIFYSYSARLEAIFREAEEQQAVLEACILQQMQAKCDELEQQHQQQQEHLEQLQHEHDGGADRGSHSEEETVVSSAAAAGVDHTAALIGTQLALSRTRAQEALVSASDTLLHSQQGVMSLELHCVLAGLRVSLMRRGPTVSSKERPSMRVADGANVDDPSVSFGQAPGAAAAANGAATAAPTTATTAAPPAQGTFAARLKSVVQTRLPGASPPGSPRRPHHRRRRWIGESPPVAAAAAAAAAGGGVFGGLTAAATSAFEGFLAQQQAATSLMSADGGGEASGPCPPASVAIMPGGGGGSSATGAAVGGWLSACLPLTDPILGEAYRPYQTVAPLVTLLLGGCFIQASTSTDGQAQLHVALQGVELRDDTNIAPLCLSSLYLGSGSLGHPLPSQADTEAAAAAASAAQTRGGFGKQQRHHHRRAGGGAAAARAAADPAAPLHRRSTAVLQHLADSHFMHAEQTRTSKRLARARTSVLVTEAKALGPLRQRGKSTTQQQEQQQAEGETGEGDWDEGDDDAGSGDESCPLILCCPRRPHLDARVRCSAMEETLESVVSLSKARLVVVWEVVHEILRVASQLMEELPVFPLPPPPLPPSSHSWSAERQQPQQQQHASPKAPVNLDSQEQLDLIVKKLLMARRRHGSVSRRSNASLVSAESKVWGSNLGRDSIRPTRSAMQLVGRQQPQASSSPAPAARATSLPHQFLGEVPLRPSTRFNSEVQPPEPLQEQEQEQDEQQDQQQQPGEREEEPSQRPHRAELQEGTTEETSPEALPKWVPLDSADGSSLFDSERLLRAIEETRFGGAAESAETEPPAFTDKGAEARSRHACAQAPVSLMRVAGPWGLPRNAFARGEFVAAVACGGAAETFNRCNELPRLNLLLRIKEAEVWLPTEPVRMPFEPDGGAQGSSSKRGVQGATGNSSSSHSDRRRQQQLLQHGGGDAGETDMAYRSSVSDPSAMGLGAPGAGGPSAVTLGKKGRLLFNKLRFEHRGSGESKAATDASGIFPLRRRRGDATQQQFLGLPEAVVTAPAGVASGIASAAAGVAAAAVTRGRRALQGGLRSNTGLSVQQQQLLHGSSTASTGKRWQQHARHQRPTTSDYWRGLRRLVVARHRISADGAAAIAAFAEHVPKLVALSAAFELNLGVFFLQRRQQVQQQQELETGTACDAKEMIITELDHVHRLATSGASPLAFLAPFCPCLVRCGLAISNVCGVTAQPELMSPLLPCALAWESLRLNSPVLSPTRLQLRLTLCVPSFFALNERLCGISSEASAAIRRQYGVLEAAEPEGLAFTFDCDPVVLTLDTLSVVLAYQLLAIVGAVATAAGDFFTPAPPTHEGSRLAGGDVSDTQTSVPKSVAATAPLLYRPLAAAAAGGAAGLLPYETYSAPGNAEEEAGVMARHSLVGSSSLNPVLVSFIAEQQEQQQRQQQLHHATLTDLVSPREGDNPEGGGRIYMETDVDSEVSFTLTTEEALEGLLHTMSIGIEVSNELFKLALWDTFSVSRKCCFSLTVEDVKLRVASKPRSSSPIPQTHNNTTLAACSHPLVASCCAALQEEELVARHQRLRLKFRRMQAARRRDSRSSAQRHHQQHRHHLQQLYQQQEQQQQQQEPQQQQAMQPDQAQPHESPASLGGEQRDPLSDSFYTDSSSQEEGSDDALGVAGSVTSNNSTRRQRRKLKQQQQLRQQQRLQYAAQQQQQSTVSRLPSRGWRISQGSRGLSSSFSTSKRNAKDGEKDKESEPPASCDEDRLQVSESLQGLPWTEERRQTTSSDIASAWATGDISWRLWRDLEQQQHQQQQAGKSGLQSAMLSDAGPLPMGSFGGSKQQQQHTGVTAPGGAAKHRRRGIGRLRHMASQRNNRRRFQLPKSFRRWLVSQYRAPTGAGAHSTPAGVGGLGAGPGGPLGAFNRGAPNSSEETTAGRRLRRVVLASEPWVTADAAFMFSLEHLNRLEGTSDATVEPWRVEVVGSKAALSLPTLLDVRASWLNLNVNVALVDALLVYGYALIGVVVRQRSLLLLNRRRLGPKQYPGASITGGPRESCAGAQTAPPASVSAHAGAGGLKKGESLETRSQRQPGGGAIMDGGVQQQQMQPGGACGSEESDVSQALLVAAAAAAAEVPGYYAVLRPDGTVVGSNGFDLFASLEAALSLELLGDHLLQKSSSQMSPSAEFAGDQLRVAQQQQQQQIAAPAPEAAAVLMAKEKETGTQQQQQQAHAAATVAAAGDLGGSPVESTGKPQEDSNPLLYNLLGQPIAIMTGLQCEDGADVLSGTWCVVGDQGSFALPLDENSRVLPFLVRLRLFNYVYDLPSQVFCFTTETREVVRLSVPENPLPPTIHMQQEEGRDGGDEASETGAPNKSSRFLRVARRFDGRGSSSANGGAAASAFGGGGRARREHRAVRDRRVSSIAAASKRLRKRDWWVPSALPKPRSSVYLMWRTSAFASASGTPRHDLFLSSCISLRNNTELPLAILRTVPGPTDERRSVFATFRKKFELQPTKPPTSSMPPFTRLIDAFKQHERKSKKRHTQQHHQQQQPLRTFPPVLKLPAMEHYIVDDLTSTDIGRKFSMVADNPSSDDDAGSISAAAAGAAAAAAAAFVTSSGGQPEGRVKFAMEGYMEQQLLKQQRRMRSSLTEKSAYLAHGEQHQAAQQLLLQPQQPDESADTPSADPAATTAAPAAAAATTAAGTGESAGMDTEEQQQQQQQAESSPSSDEPEVAPKGILRGPRLSKERRRSLPPPEETEFQRERHHRRSRRGSRKSRRASQNHTQDKSPLVPGVDYIVLDSKERQLLPIPLFWLLTENAPLWCCLADRLPKYKQKVRRFVTQPKNADFLAEEKSQRAISGGLLANYRPKRSTFPPKQIHIDDGVALSASIVGVALRSSTMGRANCLEGLFFEVVLEHCLCVCNRLPRPITLRFSQRDCGFQQQQQQQQPPPLTFDSLLPAPPTEIQVEAGAEVSLPADPSQITVFFGSRVSRPVEIDYLMPGTAVQRVTMEIGSNDDVSSSSVGLFPGGSGALSPRASDVSPSASLEAAAAAADAGDASRRSPPSVCAFGETKLFEQESLHEPASLLLWGEVTDHRGTTKTTDSATGQRLHHGTFVRTLTLFADFWVVNRTGYMLLLRRHGNGWLQSLPPFQRVVLSHDFGASRLAVGLPSSQYSKVKDFDLYSREEKSRLSRCLHAAFGARNEAAAWSGEFLLSDMGAYQIQLERTETNPLLHYSVSMGIAPAPFSRTTVVEILPSYVLVNETQKALWVCEAAGGADTRCHSLEPGAIMEFHPQSRKPVAILITAIPQKGLVRRPARADLSWESYVDNATSAPTATAAGESKRFNSSILSTSQRQHAALGAASDVSAEHSPRQGNTLTDGGPSPLHEGLTLARQMEQLGAAHGEAAVRPLRSRSPTQQLGQLQGSPSVSSRGAGGGSCSAALQHQGEGDVPLSSLPPRESLARPHQLSVHAGNTWQLDDDETFVEGVAGMLWSGPVDIDSARLVQVRHPQEPRGAEAAAAAAAAGRPLSRFSSGSSTLGQGNSFCLTEVEVCLYSGAKFVRLHDPTIPDFVLLNKTSFPLFIGQHGVAAHEVVPPVPRQHLKKSYEFLGSRYGLPFAFYDPTKEKKLEVWRMSTASAAPTSHRLSGRLSHLHSRLRSSSRHNSISRGFGLAGVPGAGPVGSTPSDAGVGILSGHRPNQQLFPHQLKPSKGRGPLTWGAQGAPQQPAQGYAPNESFQGRFDAATLRRIRREYAEVISLKASHGQQGLIRLVLQSTTGTGAPGGPPPQADRVVVCVRRPVVKGSTYLVFFEATRALHEAAKVSSAGAALLSGMGHMKDYVQQGFEAPFAGQLQRLERPEALLIQGAEGAWRHVEDGAQQLERYLPWTAEGVFQPKRIAGGPSKPSGGAAAVLLSPPPHSSSNNPDRTVGLTEDGGRHPPLSEPCPFKGLSTASTVANQKSVRHEETGAEAARSGSGPRIAWDPVESYIAAGDIARPGLSGKETRPFGGAMASVLKKRQKKKGPPRRRGGSHDAAADMEVGESDEEETERPPLCSLDLSVNLFLVGAGLSLVDSKPAEIFYASLELLQVFYKKTQEGEKVRLTVGWVQIDNHTPMAYYPTMLRPITDLRANVRPPGFGGTPKAVEEEQAKAAAAAAAAAGGDPGVGKLRTLDRGIRRDPQRGVEGGVHASAWSPKAKRPSTKRRHAHASFLPVDSGDGAGTYGVVKGDEAGGLGGLGAASRSRIALSARRRSLSRLPLPEAEEAKALHSEAERLKLLEDDEAVAQLILERRTTMDGRGLTVIPQCVLRLAPLSVNIDFQLAFALLMFLDDLLQTTDLDLLQQSVKDIRTSETERDSASWRAMLGPVEGALAEVIRGSGDSAGKVFLGSLDVGRVFLVINIRNKRRGGEEEEQPHSELIRGVLAIMKSSPYISDANLVFASEVHQNLCGPLVALVSDILQKYIGQAIKQIFQLLGAVDLFGNPVIMCKHWKAGAAGCFYEVRRGLALWGTPGFAFLSFGRGLARFGTAFVAGFLDSSGRFFGSWFQCLEALARNSDAYSVLPEMQGQGAVTDQPGSIAEGLVSGGKGFAFTLALSLANFCVKPVKATQLHLAQHSAGTKGERAAAGAKGLGIGIASGFGSLCFGLPSSLLLLLSSSCVGALNQIQAVPMLESVRPRRVFGAGGWRTECYSFALAAAQGYLRRSSRGPAAQILFMIPVHARQRDEGETVSPTAEAGWAPRLQKLEQRLQQHTRMQHNQRKRKTHLFLAVGLRKLGLLDGRKVLWSCFRGDVVQIQICMSITGDHNNPTNCAYFLSLLHFKPEARPPPDEGLARHNSYVLFCRCCPYDAAAAAAAAAGLRCRCFAAATLECCCCGAADSCCCRILLLLVPALLLPQKLLPLAFVCRQGDVRLNSQEQSSGSGSSYRSSTYSSSSSTSSSSYSEEEGTDDFEYDFSETTSDTSGTFEDPLSRGFSLEQQQASAAAAAANKGQHANGSSLARRSKTGGRIEQAGLRLKTKLTTFMQRSRSLPALPSQSLAEQQEEQQQQQQQPQQQQPQKRAHRWTVLKRAKVGDWLLGRGQSGDGNPLRERFELRWIEFPSEAAARQAFDVLSHLLDSAPGQGAADPTLFSLL
ncbi:hypothetical protein Emag_000604 [Eimeria magna]